MATFGNTATGGTSSGRKNEIIACRFTLGEDASVTKLTAYAFGGAGPGTINVRGIIYAESGGLPGILKGLTDEVVYDTATWPPAEQDFTFPSPVSLTAADYYLGVFLDNATDYMYLHSDAGSTDQTRFDQTVTYPTPPDPFGTPDWQESWALEIFATYELPAGGIFYLKA